MRVKSLLLATISLMGIQTSAHGEQWGKFRCLRDCRQDTCSEEQRKEACEANCAHLDPSVLEPCQTAKPQARPTPPPRRALSLSQQVQPPSEPSPKGDEGQAQDSPRGRPQGLRFSKPPVLEQEPSKVDPSENKAPQRSIRPLPPSPQQPSGHNAGEKVLTAEEKMAAQVTALNEGKGVKVKHMKEKLEGLEKVVEALEKRISMLDPLAGSIFGVQETLKKLQVNTGFDKPEVRNNPEQDIEYKPEQFSAVSSASGTLDGTSCQAALTKIQQKTKETKDKQKSQKLSYYGGLLTEMCARTKDLNRNPTQKVADAEAINKAFSEAQRIN